MKLMVGAVAKLLALLKEKLIQGKINIKFRKKKKFDSKKPFSWRKTMVGNWDVINTAV